MTHPSKPQPDRRTVNSMLAAAAASPLLAPGAVHAQGAAQANTQGNASAMRPFRVEIPQARLDHIRARLKDTEWPDKLDAPDMRFGVNYDYMKSLAAYWLDGYDWRKAEASLNRYPQFMARIGDYDVHFYYVKGRGPKPMPLIMSHGWPGSVLEYLDAIGPLSDPAAHGGSADDAFDVIVPSLPGFGFSGKPKGKPIGRPTTATLWDRLMREVLGYQKYAAQGGDIGSGVTVHLALNHKDSLYAIHCNTLSEQGPPPPVAQQSAEEQAWRRRAAAYNALEHDYLTLQQHKPATIAFGLADNPIGVAAWIGEKMKSWGDTNDPIEPVFTKDQMLTNIMIYLVTNTIGTSFWMYRARIEDPDTVGKVTVPTAKVSLPHDNPGSDPARDVLERGYNLVRYTRLPHGGHFAFWEQPALMVADVREFFRGYRGT